MRNYNANDLNEWVRPFLPKIQYVIIAHTNFRPCDQSKSNISVKRRERSEFLEKTMKLVSQRLYKDDPKLPFRKQREFRPLTFTTVEGLSPNLTREKTMHFNILIGNLPEHFTKQMLMFHFMKNWVGRFDQSEDIWIKSVDELVQESDSSTDSPIQVVSRYILKDAFNNKSNAWSTDGTLDIQNTWLPHDATKLK